MDETEQRLSYKFQRLRERLRSAIASGEFSGKLPGERLLAQRYSVNAKTLSKALTDLAAEGLLDRTIGRGTFVRAAATAVAEEPATRPAAGRWLLFCKADCLADPICRALRALNADQETVTDATTMRPSLLNQFSAVIDVHASLPDAMLRDLLLRSRRLVRIDASPRMFSTHAVMIDRATATSLLVRDLVRNDFHRIVIVDDAPGETADVARSAVVRLQGNATVVDATPEDVPAIDGIGPDVAFVGASSSIASDVRRRLASAGARVPTDVSVACVGVIDADGDACSGYAVTARQVARTVADLIAEPQLNRPTALWLVGAYVDRGTVRGDGGTEN